MEKIGKWILDVEISNTCKGRRTNMSKFSLFGKFLVQEEERDTMVKILLEAADSMKNLDECEIYLVNTTESEPNSVYVYEVWSNEDAHQASLALEETQTLIRKAKTIITGIERISSLNTMGGKGLSSSAS